MRADIDFTKFGRKELSKGKKILIYSLYFLFVIAIASVCAVYAYFTSKTNASGNLYFGEIDIGFYKGENELSSSTFETEFESLNPGDKLDLSNISINNIGTHDAYVLMNLDVEITNTNATTLHYNTWYNVYGEEVNISDMAANTTTATKILKDESAVTNIKWQVPSDVLTNEYKKATANVKLSAYASQTNLHEATNYADSDLYASYYICKNASTIADTTQSKNLLDFSNIPVRRATYSDGVWVSNISSSYFCNFQIEDESVLNSLLKAGEAYTFSVPENPDNKRVGIVLYGDRTDNINHQEVNSNAGETSVTINVNDQFTSFTKLELRFNRALGTDATDAFTDTTSEFTMFQLEKGSTATEYEPYFKQQSYNGLQASGEPLRKIGEIVDTIDYTTMQVTRNIGKIEFTGEENWQEHTYDVYKSYKLLITNKVNGFQTSKCSHFENIDNAWASSKFGIYSDINTSALCYFKTPTEVSINYLEEWKNWLAEQHEAGTPITLWYVLVDDAKTTQTIHISKNLYKGAQYLRYKTNAQDNTCNSTANVYVTNGATESYTTEPELGENAFNIMWNYPTVLSVKCKRNSADIVSGSQVKVTYYSDTASSNVLGTNTSFSNVYSNDEKYHYMYIQIPALSSLYSSTIKRVGLTIIDYWGSISRDFEIKDIKLEVGDSPTNFEVYDKTTYAYVNGSPLRVVGDVKDTYAYNYDSTTGEASGTITRNIAKRELIGAENWGLPSLPISGYSSYRLTNFFKVENKPFACSHFETVVGVKYDLYANNIATSYITDTKQLIINISNDIANSNSQTTTENWIKWLQGQSANGTPLTIWYPLATATTETI